MRRLFMAYYEEALVFDNLGKSKVGDLDVALPTIVGIAR